MQLVEKSAKPQLMLRDFQLKKIPDHNRGMIRDWEVVITT